jgi:hypothetical protein
MGLKLEQQKNSKVRLIIRKNTGLLTWDFAFALCIALGLHLSAFFLFSIDLGSFLNIPETPTTILVVSDPSSVITDAMDQEEKPLHFPSFLVIKREKTPALPNLESEDLPKAIPKSFDLSHLEFNQLKGPGTSRFSLSRGNTFAKEPEKLTSKKCCKGILEFKALPKTGEIFWVHWIEPTGDTKLDHHIVENLKNARLAPSSASAQGIIEVEFHS